jgi:hypothetical protein
MVRERLLNRLLQAGGFLPLSAGAILFLLSYEKCPRTSATACSGVQDRLAQSP